MAQRTIKEQVRGQLSALTVMFLLGMAVSLVGLPSELSGSAKTFSSILLGLHALVGIGLLIGVFLVLHLVDKSNASQVKLARLGGILIGLTFIAGVITMATENNWWSYAMAVGFIASFLVYGTLFASVNHVK